MNSDINRRQFMARSYKAGASILAACSIGYWFYDSAGPARSAQDASGVQIPDFSMPQLGQKRRPGSAEGKCRLCITAHALRDNPSGYGCRDNPFVL
jgi:hypothetical protein